MLDDFTTVKIDAGQTTIFVRSFGSGPPILLLHGFPQTHLMWRRVAPLITANFTVVCADLRGLEIAVALCLRRITCRIQNGLWRKIWST
jgi:hypothetical protein